MAFNSNPGDRRTLRHVWNASRVALVVGTVLCLINDSFVNADLARTALNYFVPFCVSLYSRISLARESQSRSKE